MTETVEQPKVEEPKLTRAQRRELKREMKPVLIHTPKGFQRITKGADRQIWEAVEAELEKQRTGAKDIVYKTKDDDLTPQQLADAKKQLQGHLTKEQNDNKNTQEAKEISQGDQAERMGSGQ